MSSAGGGRALRGGTVSLGLLALGLGGCATPVAPPQVGYLAPSGVAPAARSAVVQRSPNLLLGDIVDRLQQSSFTITDVDEEAGLVVVRYRGDPEPYVDCGWIVTYEPAGLERVPAASSAASFDRIVNKFRSQLDRQLQLDGRMVVSLEPRGSGTMVSATTTYVLTKSIAASGPAGGRAREVISFRTGESGEFAKGTRCQPNGQFERVVLDSLPATSFVAQAEPAPAPQALDQPAPAPEPTPQEPVQQPRPAPESSSRPVPPTPPAPVVAETTPAPTPPAEARSSPQATAPPPAPTPAPPAELVDLASVQARVDQVAGAMPCAAVEAAMGPNNSVLLSGYVDSEQDIARLRESVGGIAGVGAVDSSLEVQPWPFCEILQVIDPYRSADRQAGLVITTPDRNTRLSAGDPLTLDIFLPTDAEYLYLGYVQNDGRVGYITVLPVRQWVQDTGAIRFETGYEISPPFGREMVIAITSGRPLFDEALPAYQPPDEYIALLRERLEALRERNPEVALDASHLILTTQPDPAF